MTVLLETTQ